MPITVFEVWHVCDVRYHAVHRPIGVELWIKQIARQWLLVCSLRAGLGLADLADSCSQAAAAHHSLRRRRANLYAEPLGDIAVTDGSFRTGSRRLSASTPAGVLSMVC